MNPSFASYRSARVCASLNKQRYESHLSKVPDPRILVCTGPAGTGKTMLACKYAVEHLYDRNYEKLIITRPNVSIEEELGYLPGTMEQKMNPWMIPIFDYLEKFTDRRTVRNYINEGLIEITPLGFMRGRTFDNTLVVADEMQNSTNSQMVNLLTRIGKDSKLVITGDLSQCDLPNVENGLQTFLNRWNKYIDGNDTDLIDYVQLDRSDVKRSEVVSVVLDIYDINDH